MTFAIIETGGKQYKVQEGQKMRVEKLASAGDKVVFNRVLLVGNGSEVSIGAPHVSGAKVEGRLVRHGRDDKKIVFRYHSKTRYRKKKGHRQPFSEVEIVKISS
ncbi:50S ribosomal protein L21 [Candidatus Wolfebacteria bacterium]|nr:50S ribosomal protein L21 [Candidatus Wolfebacteria bacterium]